MEIRLPIAGRGRRRCRIAILENKHERTMADPWHMRYPLWLKILSSVRFVS